MRGPTWAILLMFVLIATGSPAPATALTGPDEAAASADRASRRVLGYYVPYDPASWISLESQAQSIDIVAAQWVTIDGCGRLASSDDQTLKHSPGHGEFRSFHPC